MFLLEGFQKKRHRREAETGASFPSENALEHTYSIVSEKRSRKQEGGRSVFARIPQASLFFNAAMTGRMDKGFPRTREGNSGKSRDIVI